MHTWMGFLEYEFKKREIVGLIHKHGGLFT